MRMRAWRPALRLLALAVLLSGAATPAYADSERDDATAQLEAVNRDIERLQAELEGARERQGTAQAALRDVELELQAAARRARALDQARAGHEQEVARLEQSRLAYLDQLAERGDELQAQVVAAWRAGRESRLKMLLNQDDPARLARLLSYYEYLSDAQGERIRELHDALATLDVMSAAVDAELAALADAEAELAKAETALESRRLDQLAAIAVIETELDQGQDRLAELQRDRQDLETLLERLDDSLADIPVDLGGGLHPRELKGRLPMPVNGRVAAAYGQPRAAGLRWQGWLIGADTGTEVHAVAYGRVAYADWLRGYGLLLIIDHGEGFMSLYGHNEALLAEVGDWVNAGRPVAISGRNAGLAEGVYFELRNDGKAVDPAAWVQRN